MRIIDIDQADASLADYASGLSEEPVIVTQNGKPIAALVNLENVDFETISLSSNPKFKEMVERSRASRREKGGISSAEMRQRLGLSEN